MDCWDYPGPYTLTVHVEPQHIDSLGHVNNVVYTQWCQDVAWQHSESLGLGPDDYQRLRRAIAIVNANYDYLAAAFLEQELTMATWLTASDGRLRMERRFQLLRSSDSITLFRASWRVTCINLDNGKPARMPAEFLQCYEPAIVT